MPETIYRKLKDLKLLGNNPRQIGKPEFETLCKSLIANPDYFEARPLILSDRTGELVIIAGNMRYRAAKHNKQKEVPTILLSGLTEEREAEIIIRDNVNNGAWDYDLVANEWSDYPLADWGLDVPGFEAVDEVGDADAEPQIDKAAELNKKWGVVSGDLWQIGSHRLLCGDSSDKEAVSRLMGQDKANLIWTDPPYGVAYGDKIESANPMGYRVRTIENDDLDDEALAELLRTAMNNMDEFTTSGCAIYAACPAGKQLPVAIDAFTGSCFEFRWQLVWVKNSLVLSRADYHFRHENILYGWKRKGSHYFTDDRTQDSIFEVDRPSKSDEHPTMKPLPLIQQMIRNSSRKGEIVVDMFGGSGSTMLAAANEGRKARLMELTPNFSAVILERMATAFPDIEIKRIENAKGKATN